MNTGFTTLFSADYLESSTQQHTLRLVFSETVSRLLEPEKYVGGESVKMGETSRGDLGAGIETSEPVSEEIHGKSSAAADKPPLPRSIIPSRWSNYVRGSSNPWLHGSLRDRYSVSPAYDRLLYRARQAHQASKEGVNAGF